MADEAVFNFADRQALDESFFDELHAARPEPAEERESIFAIRESLGRRPAAAANDQSDQFVVFQMGTSAKGPAIVDPTGVEPGVAGSAEEPDVLVRLELMSFHLPGEEVDDSARATMRINFGEESVGSKVADTATWAIAAGLDLYDRQKKKKAEPKQLAANLTSQFGNHPIVIRGGLSKFSFDVIQHEEPKWWQRIFSFARSETGQQLISLVGFPAITNEAVRLVDDLLNRVLDNEPKVLFNSDPMRLALSTYARNGLTGGSERVRAASLAPGYCILARRRDYTDIVRSDAIFYPGSDRLVPGSVTPEQFSAGEYDDPFQDMTYAVFRITMKGTKVDETLAFH